jgi:hypothetical protein
MSDMLKINPFKKLQEVDSEYVYDHAGRNLLEMWESKVFGRCVFNKMGKKDGGSIKNYLEKKVQSYNV